MEEKLEAKITEHISGYYIVLINHIEIAHCRTWEEANQLVEHFMAINQDKNPIRLE